MKMFQIVDHKTGVRSPVMEGESLIDIALSCQKAICGSADDSPLDDLVLVLCDGLVDGSVVVSRQPLMKLRTILELHAKGVKEPGAVPAMTVSETMGAENHVL